jgi:hypothetical protein
MGSLPGGGVCPVEGVVGVCPDCPDGGERERGAVAPQKPWSPALGHKVLYVHALSS